MIWLSKLGRLCRMIPNWPEHSAKLAFRKRTSGALCNYCKKAAARIRWTRTASITWGCLTCSLSKSLKPRRPWKVRWQLGFRSRLLQKPSAAWLSPRQSNGLLESPTIVGFLYAFTKLASGITKLIMRSITLIISHLWRFIAAWIWRWHETSLRNAVTSSYRNRNHGDKPMKHKFTTMIMALSAMGALATQANAVTFDFQSNGQNVNLGPTSTFTVGGFSLTASGFLTSGGPTDLYAKFTSGNPSETGLGTALDSSEHEILTTDFIQLTLPTTPPSNFSMVLLASVQAGEQAKVYFTTTPGTLTGATLIGTITSADGSVTIPAGDQTGFIDITAGAANILLESATVNVPDSGSAVALLGIAL